LGIIQRQSIQASVITYAGALLGYLNFILLYPIYLTAEQVGLTRLLISVAVLLSQFALLGTSYTLQRYFPYFNNKPERHYGFITLLYAIAIIGYVCFSLLFLLFKQPIQSFYEQRSALFNQHYGFVFLIAFFLLVFELAFFYARSLLKTVVPTFIKEVLLRLLQTFVLFAYVFHLVDFVGFLYLFVGSYLIHYVVVLIYLAYLGQLFIAPVRVKEVLPINKLTRYTWFVYAASIAAVYTANIDVIMLGALAGLNETAVYSVAFFIATLVIIPARTMNQVSIPIIAEAWKNHDIPKLHQLYKQTSINQLLIGGFIYLMLWINIDWVVQLLPEIYAPVKWVFLIIGFGRLLDMATGINGEIILYSKHIRFNLLTNVLLIFISTAATYFLIPRYGVIGAAISIPVAYIAYNAIRMIFLQVVYKVHPFTIHTVKAIILLALLSLMVMYLPDAYKTQWVAIIISLLLAVAYFLMAIQLRISEELTALWQRLRKLILGDSND
jgi:O-antigen/teichoic acid export membrane protein